MSEHGESEIIEAGALPPMITIPLPPREKALRRSWRSFFRNLIRRIKGLPVFQRSDIQKQRSREFSQAFAAAIAINALIAVLFMLIWIKPAIKGGDHSFKVSLAESVLDQTSSEKEESGSAARASKKSTAPPPAKVVTTTAMQDLVFEAVTDPGLGDVGYDSSAMTLDFGNSLNAKDLRAARNGYATVSYTHLTLPTKRIV